MFVQVNGINDEMQYVHRNHVVSIAPYSNAEAQANAQNKVEKAKVDPMFQQMGEDSQQDYIKHTLEEGDRYKDAKSVLTTSTGQQFALTDTAEEVMERLSAV